MMTVSRCFGATATPHIAHTQQARHFGPWGRHGPKVIVDCTQSEMNRATQNSGISQHLFQDGDRQLTPLQAALKLGDVFNFKIIAKDAADEENCELDPLTLIHFYIEE